MRGGLRIGRLFGIDVTVDLSWGLMFLLMSTNLTAVFRAWHPTWALGACLFLAVVAALLFFGSVVAHEFAHALVATSFGMRVRQIRLFLFGGVSDIEREPPSHHAYTMLSGNPVRNYRADITLVPDDRGGTNITWSGTFDPLVPGTGRVLVAIYRRLIGGFARKVAAYAEKSS